jgi:hypothetical protein
MKSRYAEDALVAIAALTTRVGQFTQKPINEPEPTIENDIQAQISAVGLMTASIVQDVYNLEYRSSVFAIVNKHYAILQQWEARLPPPMKLAELKKESGNFYAEAHRRSLILVHVIFFGAQILLQRRLLVAIAQERINRTWTLDGSFVEGQAIERQCVTAAEEIVYLLDLLGYTRHMFRRCWLCM